MQRIPILVMTHALHERTSSRDQLQQRLTSQLIYIIINDYYFGQLKWGTVFKKAYYFCGVHACRYTFNTFNTQKLTTQPLFRYESFHIKGKGVKQPENLHSEVESFQQMITPSFPKYKINK